MPKAYSPTYRPLPDEPGFWFDSFLTNYGFSVVRHNGVLYALGWSEEPTLVDNMRQVPKYREEFQLPEESLIHPGGYFGPCPVPSHRRYEMRKRKQEFKDSPPSPLSKIPVV